MYLSYQRNFRTRILVFLVIFANVYCVNVKHWSEEFYLKFHRMNGEKMIVNLLLEQNQETYKSWCEKALPNSKLDTLRPNGPHEIKYISNKLESVVEILEFNAIRCIPITKDSTSDKLETLENERFYLLPYEQSLYKLWPDKPKSMNWTKEPLWVVGLIEMKDLKLNE